MIVNEYGQIALTNSGEWTSTIIDNDETIETKHNFMTEAIMFVEHYANSKGDFNAKSSVCNINR